MKKIPTILSVGFAVIATILVFTYIGYKLNHIAIGIMVGFLLTIGYLFAFAFKK